MIINENIFHVFHEIKNSVTFISSSLQLLQKTNPDIKNNEYFADVMCELDTLKTLIINLSRDCSGKQELQLQPLHLDSVFQTIRSTVHSMEEMDSFYVKTTIAENLPAIVADPFRLKSVLMNLIKNSYEAMNKTGTIFLRAFSDGTQVYIELQDFGGGIPKEQETSLFDPFCTSKENGSGLGLAIAKKFMLEMNGAIFYESRLGDGCTFRLALPIAQT